MDKLLKVKIVVQMSLLNPYDDFSPDGEDTFFEAVFKEILDFVWWIVSLIGALVSLVGWVVCDSKLLIVTGLISLGGLILGVVLGIMTLSSIFIYSRMKDKELPTRVNKMGTVSAVLLIASSIAGIISTGIVISQLA